MSTSTVTPPRSLPQALRRGLTRVSRRLRTIALVRGLGTLALVLGLGAIGGMIAVVAFVLPQPARWAIWLAWIGAGILTLIVTLGRPLSRRIRWTDLAAVAERGHPELGEQLTESVALLGEDERAHGSPSLIRALAH